MSIKLIPTKIAKKDLLSLYDITHPTLRIWLRREGLEEFIGRKRFIAHEVVQIFQALGRPRLARKAAQALKDIYAQLRGVISDEEQYKAIFGEEVPPQRQDQLEDTEEELDAADSIDYPSRKIDDPRQLDDALNRLTCTAILLKGQKALKKQLIQQQKVLLSPREYPLKKRKRLKKGKIAA